MLMISSTLSVVAWRISCAVIFVYFDNQMAVARARIKGQEVKQMNFLVVDLTCLPAPLKREKLGTSLTTQTSDSIKKLTTRPGHSKIRLMLC